MTDKKKMTQIPQPRRKPVLRKSTLKDLDVRNRDPKGGAADTIGTSIQITCTCPGS